MAQVVPTVLATTPDEYGVMLKRAEALSGRVHVDICDGEFADAKTVGLAQVYVDENAELDLHLMLRRPLEQLETALSLKPSLIIFHAESDGDLLGAMAHVRELGVKAGVALLGPTTVEQARDLVDHADHVLIFTGNLGHYGGEFQVEQLQKSAEIRAVKPDVEIGVDGGVNNQNAAVAVLQGTDVLYVGGYLQQATDPAAAFAALQAGASA